MPDQAKEQPRPARPATAGRQDRLAAALKANLARRKAQARRRAHAAANADKPVTDGR